MKNFCLKHIRWIVLILLLSGVLICRFIPGAGEWYALLLYPVISFTLSAAASALPFSLCEIVVVASGLFLLVYPVVGRSRKQSWKSVAGKEVEVLLWLYAWFYWGWGMNYFRDSFFERVEVKPCTYDEVRFKQFLTNYTDSLNRTFLPEVAVSMADLEEEIKSAYINIPEQYGLVSPWSFQHPKRSFATRLYSGVGVLGYMGPFFDESHLNEELLPLQLPFTYAHELSHLLGISSEAEANFWAYQVCIRSSVPDIRYSGYFGMFPYVIVNARGLLSDTDFDKWLHTVRPEVMQQLYDKQAYWDARYSSLLGKIQDTVYNWYLKGNQIPSGQKNYAQVIGMILSMPEKWWY